MDFYLNSLTNRSQEKDFEHFCKGLAELEICSNLLSQTGPTGGGDSKVDSETYPVSDSLSLSWYLGIGRTAANERWAFAISAKKDWRSKIKSDVEKIFNIDRDYKKIFFMTNQYVPDKKRAELEDLLSKQYCIDVRILDRTWILDKLFNNQRQHVAIEFFNLPNDFVDEIKMGPLDYRRTEKLKSIEHEIETLVVRKDFNLLLVEKAIESSIISRELELPIVETNGRFNRAFNMAKLHGTNVQVKESLYQWAWTLYWWYDDIENYKKVFQDYMNIAVGSNNFFDIERLTNLWMNLYVIFNGDLENEVFKKSTDALIEEYNRLITDSERYNTALEARANFTFVKLFLGYDAEELFLDLKSVMQESSISLDFSFNTLTKMIMELSPHLLDSSTFNELFEFIISKSGNRTQEVTSAKLLLERGKSLLEEKPYSSIQYIGRSLIKLYKSESKEILISALFFMASSLNRVGLYWASYGYYINTYYLAFLEYIKFGNVSPYLLGASDSLRRLEINIGRIANTLEWNSLYMLSKELSNSAGYNIKSKFIEDGDRIYDGILGTFFLNMNLSDLIRITKLPDTLEVNELEMATVALKYSLGHSDPDLLNSFNNDETSINEFMYKWYDQPANSQLSDKVILGSEDSETFQAKILGCTILIDSEVIFPCLELSQSILSCIEAFMSTSVIEGAILCRYTDIKISLGYIQAESYSISFTQNELNGSINYIIKCNSFTNNSFLEAQRDTKEFLFNFMADFISNVFIFKDFEKQIEKLIVTDEALNRAIEFTLSIFAVEDLFGRKRQKIDSWLIADNNDYPLIRKHKLFGSVPAVINHNVDIKDLKVHYGRPLDYNMESVNHQNIKMSKIINIALWDKAKWRGVLFQHAIDPSVPTVLAPLFTNIEYGDQIFRKWIEEIGSNDIHNRIKVGVIKGIDKTNPFHYRVVFSEDLTHDIPSMKDGYIVIPSRFCVMEPTNNINLNNFIEHIKRTGENYFLTPAFINPKSSSPEIQFNFLIKKNKIDIKDAWEVGEDSWLACAITPEDTPVIPVTVKNPPVVKLIKLKKNLK